MKDIFLADAHLLDPADENYRRLLAFLERLRGETRTLFLLGDIFEFWIGYRHTVFTPYVPVLETLRRLHEDGIQIVYVEGNHDFHLGPYFEKTLSCRILPNGGEVTLDGRRIFIAHGDLVNPGDRGYRILRRFLRSRALRGLKALLPPDWAWNIARWSSRQSHKSRPAKQIRWSPRDLLTVHARHLFAAGYPVVVTAHFHSPWIERSEEGTIISLGDWIDQYSYAVHEDGEFRLETY